MLRRKPTRLELKLDDIEEFESIRKDLEVRTQFLVLGGNSRELRAQWPETTGNDPFTVMFFK